jgi:flagellar biogenesis protein FliO
VVLATCLGTLLLARRWLMKSGMVMESQRNPRLQIVASLSIAPRSQLHIVRLDNREVLVGVDSRGLQQMQIVPPSFDAVLRTSDEQDAMPAKVEKSNEACGTQPLRRLFTAA